MKPRHLVFVAGLMSAALSCSAFGQQDDKLGKVHFPTSCDPKVQAEFERGVAMLHSYWSVFFAMAGTVNVEAAELCHCPPLVRAGCPPASILPKLRRKRRPRPLSRTRWARRCRRLTSGPLRR